MPIHLRGTDDFQVPVPAKLMEIGTCLVGSNETINVLLLFLLPKNRPFGESHDREIYQARIEEKKTADVLDLGWTNECSLTRSNTVPRPNPARIRRELRPAMGWIWAELVSPVCLSSWGQSNTVWYGLQALAQVHPFEKVTTLSLFITWYLSISINFCALPKLFGKLKRFHKSNNWRVFFPRLPRGSP